MQYRQLGKSGVSVSALGFGCSHIASVSTPYSRKEIKNVMASAIEKGVNFFDTADIYGQGDSERLLGSLFPGRRDNVVICTKAGLTLSASQAVVRALKPIVNPIIRHLPSARSATSNARKQREQQCFDPEYLMQCLEGSLSRLKTDFVDVFLLHNPPVEVLESKEILALMGTIRQSGKSRLVGVSCSTKTEAKAAIDIGEYDCVQLAVNIFSLSEHTELLNLAGERGIGVIAREPYDGGRLFFDDRLKRVASRLPDVDPAHVALLGLFSRDEIGPVLASMNTPSHLTNNLAVFKSPAINNALWRDLSS